MSRLMKINDGGLREGISGVRSRDKPGVMQGLEKPSRIPLPDAETIMFKRNPPRPGGFYFYGR